MKHGTVADREQQYLHKIALVFSPQQREPGSWVERPTENKVALLGFLKEEDSCGGGVRDSFKYLLNVSEG